MSDSLASLFSRLLLPLPDISLTSWDLGPLSQHRCISLLLRCFVFRKVEASDWWWTARDHGKGTVSAVVSFPPSFARTFSSRERRLGTRQSLYKDMLPLKIYPYLSDPRNKRNRRKICRNVQFTESMDQLWLAINLYSVYNSNDQRRFFNTMECDHRGKREGKWGERRTILRYFIFLDRSL